MYRAEFNSLVNNNTHIGLHNREYFFALRVINNAKLVSVERLDILVDNSPPQTGVVLEGANGETDIDYTSDRHLLINWHGFIDHESGIKKYRIGLGSACMTSGDLMHLNHNESQIGHLYETSENLMKVQLPKEGKYYTTVIAYNNALQSSEPVCSDGVIWDYSPPDITEIALANANANSVIACHANSTFLVLENITAVQLENSPTCVRICENATDASFIDVIPKIKQSFNDSDFAESICERLNLLSDDWIVYLPSDYVHLKWSLTEDESQIRDVYVGVASDPSHIQAPDIEAYLPSRRLSAYRKNHAGINRGTSFYLMIKAVNKADLETVIPFGPVIIDETPPLVKSEPRVRIDDGYVYVMWRNNNFQDMEQVDAITTILFRIGT